MKEKIIASLTIMGLCLLFISIIGASEPVKDDEVLLEPVNPDFIRYMKRLRNGKQTNVTKNGHSLDYAPAPVTVSHIKGVKDPAVNIEYPAYYDLRTLNRLSWVKDQRFYPTCWVFAAYGSLESCLLPEENVDYSEWHLAAFNGFDYGLQNGGNSWASTAYLLRWDGPVEERLSPYPTAPSTDIGEYHLPVAKHIQQVLFLPEREHVMDNNTIKYYVTNYGPVDFAFNWDFDSFNNETNSMYTPQDGPQNHRLVIVGWDDDYPASKFKFTPPGNGAFIARNSWGPGWGEEGYCYISYYDESFEEFTIFNNAEPTTNYETIYQHDPLGRTSAWGKKDSYGANIFTAVDFRAIGAVGFYTNDANVSYEVFVYRHVDPSSNNPLSGTLESSLSGAFTYAGYYTVPLPNMVPVNAGEKFSIVVHWTNPQHKHAVPIEHPVSGHSSAAASKPGTSFVSLDGSEWKDLTSEVENANVCIKAYTMFPLVDIPFHAERNSVESWVIQRDFVNGHFSIKDFDNAPVTDVYIHVKKDMGPYTVYKHLKRSDLPYGIYGFFEYIEKGVRYVYQVVTVDANSAITGKSLEIIL